MTVVLGLHPHTDTSISTSCCGGGGGAVEMYGTLDSAVGTLQMLLQQVNAVSFEAAQAQGLGAVPDILTQHFAMLTRYIIYCPRALITSHSLPTVLDLAKAGLTSRDKDPVRQIMSFLQQLVGLSDKQLPDAQQLFITTSLPGLRQTARPSPMTSCSRLAIRLPRFAQLAQIPSTSARLCLRPAVWLVVGEDMQACAGVTAGPRVCCVAGALSHTHLRAHVHMCSRACCSLLTCYPASWCCLAPGGDADAAALPHVHHECSFRAGLPGKAKDIDTDTDTDIEISSFTCTTPTHSNPKPKPPNSKPRTFDRVLGHSCVDPSSRLPAIIHLNLLALL